MAVHLVGSSTASGELRTSSALSFEAEADSATSTTYVRLVLDDFSVPAGTVVTCADLRLKVPDAEGQEIELWPVLSNLERPWARANPREHWKSRPISAFAQAEGGFVRLDLTGLLQNWPGDEMPNSPAFYLRLRTEGEPLNLTTQPITHANLILHTKRLGKQ